ncbi:MAG: hypothetical protein Q8P13_01895 [bacterium]|nr:hypothetical protein [bacterium]
MPSDGASFIQEMAKSRRLGTISTVGIPEGTAPKGMVAIRVHYLNCDPDLPKRHSHDRFDCQQTGGVVAITQEEAAVLFRPKEA